MAEIVEALDSEEAQELFEESRRREQEAEQAELRAAEFFEEQRRKQEEDEKDEGPEGTGNG
jgi:hypothetical protein